jgi:hypothetical protein
MAYKKSKTKGGAEANVDKQFRAEEDARHLEAAAQIRGDESRHQAAMRHLKKKACGMQDAVDLEEKVKKGLAEAFPKGEVDNG